MVMNLPPFKKKPIACKSKYFMWSSTIGENRQLVSNEPVEVQDCKKITDHLKESIKYTPI